MGQVRAEVAQDDELYAVIVVEKVRNHEVSWLSHPVTLQRLCAFARGEFEGFRLRPGWARAIQAAAALVADPRRLAPS